MDGRWPPQRPGVLVAGEGRLAFLTDDGPVFAAPLTDVGPVSWPWHWFGGGCRITVGPDRWNVTFVRPGGAPAASTHLLESAHIETAQSLAAVLSLGAVPAHSVAGLFDVRSGRAAGKLWQQLLPGWPGPQMRLRAGSTGRSTGTVSG